MRDILVTLMIFGTLPLILKRPYIGILVWSWVSYMNPHKLAYGFAYSLPFAQIVAITFLASLVFNAQKIRLPNNFTVHILITFLLWMLVTSSMAFYPESAFTYYVQVLKIQLFILLTIALIKDLKQLNQLLTVIVLSIGFFSIKGGIFTVMTGGGHKVWGPGGTFIEENNALAVAVLMIIPLMFYLRKIAESKLVRNFWTFAILTSAISVLGSQSRGATLSILAVALFFWLKSQGKLLSGLAIIVVLVAGYQFMPESWHERMRTTINYEEDLSATSRLDSWQYNINIANANVTGGGFKKESGDTYAIYFPGVSTAYVAHSIYFSVLGDHGWFGLLLFLLILMATWRRLSVISRLSRNHGDSHHLGLLARMLQVSLVAYLSGGAFLNLAYFDLPWHIVAIALVLEPITKNWVLTEEERGHRRPSTDTGYGLQNQESMGDCDV